MTEGHKLATKKSVTLGLNPISLSAFRMNGCPYVFAATDRPAVVHEHNGKLVYSPLNESNVSHLCTFSTEALPGAVAMCKDDRLMITAIDAIQKLHIRCAAHACMCWRSACCARFAGHRPALEAAPLRCRRTRAAMAHAASAARAAARAATARP